ncbi:MAG: methyltransferase domain-containing protein [Candidatus Lokiarchaeota archaeon]|nr:methyltransferase domain-containing protein [Candidatus Lokiarchaeota archaeon]MBD3200307.1 methyltransferase domain-containing protein [Candidatus Lokiarchaeota archaeon]
MIDSAMEPFGRALEAYYKGDKNVKIVFHRDDGNQSEDLIRGYFTRFSEFPEREKLAILKCSGKVLDIGAGTGRHSLELQKRNHEVLAIDICKKACEIIRQRGVKNVECNSVYEIMETNFDTLLLLGCSIAFVENLKGLEHFLVYAKSLLNSNGIILLDSRDVRKTDDPHHIKYQEDNINNGRYRGEIRLQIGFNGKKGDLFQILHIDPDTLEHTAQKTRWKCEILQKENSLYLAKLTLSEH